MNLSCFFVFRSVILLMCIMLCSCSKGKPMDNDVNGPSMQPIDNHHAKKLTPNKIAGRLRIDEVEFSSQLTKEWVLSNWGLPNHIMGLLFEEWVYKIEDDRLLWLWFSWIEPYPLLKAIVTNAKGEDRKVLFEETDENKLRAEDASKPTREDVPNAPISYIKDLRPRSLRRDEIKISAQLTRVQVLIDWGLPDAIKGSGIENLVYDFSDGSHLYLWFHGGYPDQLISACIVDANGDWKDKEVIFELKP